MIRSLPEIVRLRKGVFAAIILLVSVGTLFALGSVFKKRPEVQPQVHSVKNRGAVVDAVEALPEDYSSLSKKSHETTAPPTPATEPEEVFIPYEPVQVQTYTPPQQQCVSGPVCTQQSTPPEPSKHEAEKDKALRSEVFFDLKKKRQKDNNYRDDIKKSDKGMLIPAAESVSLAAASQFVDPASNQNMQLEKRDFLKPEDNDRAVYLNHAVQKPISPYQIMAGSVIPGVMITGINSELPGQLIGQVRENVYDTVTGNHLLIPQGTKLLGRYDSVIAYGQERVLIVWNRIIMPNGSSILLESMPGTDLAGYAGLKDKVNHHYGKLVTGVILSTLLSVGASVSAGREPYRAYDDKDGYDITNRLAEQAGQGANQAGQQIVSKMLNIQPTIEIRPGLTFNVMVNRDMVLKPYQE